MRKVKYVDINFSEKVVTPLTLEEMKSEYEMIDRDEDGQPDEQTDKEDDKTGSDTQKDKEKRTDISEEEIEGFYAFLEDDPYIDLEELEF